MDKTALDNDVKALKLLQGFGEQLNVFTGIGENGKPEYKTYHIAPVPIKDIPELAKGLRKFDDVAKKMEKANGGFSEKDAEVGADLILMGLKKTMKNVTKDEIMENFSFGVMVQAVKILVDVNDLGTEVDEDGNVVENPTKPIQRRIPLN